MKHRQTPNGKTALVACTGMLGLALLLAPLVVAPKTAHASTAEACALADIAKPAKRTVFLAKRGKAVRDNKDAVAAMVSYPNAITLNGKDVVASSLRGF